MVSLVVWVEEGLVSVTFWTAVVVIFGCSGQHDWMATDTVGCGRRASVWVSVEEVVLVVDWDEEHCSLAVLVWVNLSSAAGSIVVVWVVWELVVGHGVWQDEDFSLFVFDFTASVCVEEHVVVLSMGWWEAGGLGVEAFVGDRGNLRGKEDTAAGVPVATSAKDKRERGGLVGEEGAGEE